MCIVAFAWQVLDDLPLCLISNRDEFYHRPTQNLHQWADHNIVAGRDLQEGGTWMGVHPSGRWAVLTNYRDGHDKSQYKTSRGKLIQDYLPSTQTPIRFAQALEQRQCDYAGFNLVVGDHTQAVYMSNRGEAPHVLAHGVYVISNGLMNDPWQKTQHLRKRFTQEFLPMLQHTSNEAEIQHAVWDLLEDERKVSIEALPSTGIPIELEQVLSSTFIQSPIYGTRSSNFLRINAHQANWLEKIQYGEQQHQVIQQNVDWQR